MHFAFLGHDESTRRLQQALELSSHDLTVVPDSEWEGLLAEQNFDAVVVARGGDPLVHEDQLRKLVGSAVPVIASHPAADVLTSYELEMIRRETRGWLLPFSPDWFHPAWTHLRQLLTSGSDGAIGSPQQITFERRLDDRSRTKASILFAQDVAILRRLLGTISTIHAVGIPRDESSWNSLTVHLANEHGCAASWSLAAAGSTGPSRLQVVGEAGTVTVVMPDDPEAPWEFHDSGGARRTVPGDLVEGLVAESAKVKAGGSPQISWNEACLDLEIADSAEKSLRRKRSIELYTSGRTEEKTFKGFMAAGGCLILVVILLAFFVLAVWDGFRSPFRDAPVAVSAADSGNLTADGPEKWPLWARLWPVYPLVAFLLLQLLVFITRASPDEPASKLCPKKGSGPLE